MALRFDRSTYRKPKKQPNGYLRADATLTRVGIFEYRLADGSTRREYRPEDEVFHPDSLASFAMVPVTRDHPPVALDDENTHQFQVGSVGEHPKKDGDHVLASMVLTHADAVQDVETGARQELSCGYSCRLDATPGSWNGQRYDAIQRDIRGNHVALVSKGRAGPEARVRLDADDAEMLEAEPPPLKADTKPAPPRGQEHAMEKVFINGVWVEVSAQAKQLIDLEAKRADEALKALTAKAEKETARADGLKEQLDKAEKARADAADPKRIQALVASRVSLEKDASAVLEDVKLDALTDDEVKAQVLKKLCPELKLDGKSADYVQGRYEQALEAFRKDADEEPLADLRRSATPIPKKGPEARGDAEEAPAKDAEEASEKWRVDARDAWKKPHPTSSRAQR